MSHDLQHLGHPVRPGWGGRLRAQETPVAVNASGSAFSASFIEPLTAAYVMLGEHPSKGVARVERMGD